VGSGPPDGSATAGEEVSLAVPPALAGDRVDRVVATVTGLSRSQVAALVVSGAIRRGGQPVSAPSRRVAEGDLLQLDLPLTPAPGLRPDPSVEVDVVHADAALLVVDKPAGLVVHPGAGHHTGTLVQGLLARFPDLGAVGDPARPGIVHRLDRMTSGLLAVARTEEAFASLSAQLSSRRVTRRYLALAWGRVEAEAGVIEAPLGRSERDRTRMAVMAGGRPARTRYEVRRRFVSPAASSFVECWLETGRTHQVRVHLAAIGHPLVGDERYGGARRALPLDRTFLHAHLLELDHPVSGDRLAFTSALPAELEAVLARLVPEL
jgi:23S rRNA pseudouridine1911/1915/1917 synthase